MFIEVKRKDGVVAVLNTDHIETFNVASDGVSTLLIMHSGTCREVQESYDVIRAACGIGGLEEKPARARSKKS